MPRSLLTNYGNFFVFNNPISFGINQARFFENFNLIKLSEI